jgi:signal peptidase I
MQLVKVKGNSMYPVIRENDLVVVKKTNLEHCCKGNILVYHHERNGSYVIHRFIKKGKGNVLYLRGDGYDQPLESADRVSVMGKAVGLVRNNHYQALSRSKELYSWGVASLKTYAKRLLRRTPLKKYLK